MNTALIVNQDELKEKLREIIEEIIPAVVERVKAETSVRELMTTAQAADYLQCSIQLITNWSKRSEDQNRLVAGHAGADPRFFKSDLDAWLARNGEIKRGDGGKKSLKPKQLKSLQRLNRFDKIHVVAAINFCFIINYRENNQCRSLKDIKERK